MTLADLKDLSGALGISFKDHALLQQSVIHRSYLNEYPESGMASNERLEFLGDAILGFIVAEKLYRDFPDISEGEMTRRRSVLVCRETLAAVAREIRLGDYLYLGKGEAKGGGRQKLTNLTCALEAVIGAVFQDRGIKVTREVVWRLLKTEEAKTGRPGSAVDFKSKLQEIIQSKYQAAPVYRLVNTAGPDHARTFTVEVIAAGGVLGSGSGKSKKLAEAAAARAALEHIPAHFTA